MHLRKPLVLCVLAVIMVVGAILLIADRSSGGAPPAPSADAALRGVQTPMPVDTPGVALREARAVKPPAAPTTPEGYTALWRAIQQEFPFASQRDFVRLRQFCPADYNRDDTVDEADVTAYLERWQAGDGVTAYLADMNRDEVLDEADITEFLCAYFNNDCDTQRQKAIRESRPPERWRVAFRERGPPRRMLEGPQRPAPAP